MFEDEREKKTDGEKIAGTAALDAKRIEIKAILESNLCLGLAPNREYSSGEYQK